MLATDQPGPFRQQAHEWVVRLTSGSATVADAEAARLWCNRSPAHARAFAEATLLWETLEPVARRLATSDAAAVPSQTRVGRRALLGGALAASAATAAYVALRPRSGPWWSPSELFADYRTATGERRSVTIGDIAVELNTRSSLNVLPANGATRRLELVAGEAVFATSGVRGAPVVLLASGGEVSATEAKFGVRCDGATVSVVCLQGTVKVDFLGQVAMVQEHQRIVYGSNGLAPPASVDSAVATAWRDGWLIFHGTPLSEVIDEVNRYRPSRIILMNEALGSRPVNATLPLDQLDDVMTLLREAYGVKVLSLPGGIVLLT